MSRQGLLTVIVSVILSLVTSVLVNLEFDQERRSEQPAVIRVRSLELVDAQGRIRGAFELAKAGRDGDLPRLVMRDADGRDFLEMGDNGNGNGVLEFANERWNEGAVILGHLNLVDDAATRTPGSLPIGAWGLQVRSPQNTFTGVGFFNSGRLIVPMSDDKLH